MAGPVADGSPRATPSGRSRAAAGAPGSGDESEPCSAELADVPLLPRRLDGVLVEVLPDVRHGVPRRHSVEDGEARERGPRTPSSTGAGDLDALVGQPRPDVDEQAARRRPVSRQPEVGPAQPLLRPRRRGRRPSEQVDAAIRRRTRRNPTPQPATAHRASRRQHQHAGEIRNPGGHAPTLARCGSRPCAHRRDILGGQSVNGDRRRA